MTNPISTGRLVAALLVPPLAMFLAEGMSRNFWISAGLTCLGWLPGVAYTLFVLLFRSPGDARSA